MKIKLTEDAYICVGEHRLHTDDGKPSICALNTWYEAAAVDADGNEYQVIWSVREDFDPAENPDESDACNWDAPEEIISLDTGKPVIAEIEW